MGQSLLARSAPERELGLDRAIDVPLARTAIGYAVAKRALDVLLSAVGLVLCAPVLLLLALLVRMDAPGPIIFRQQRVGAGGQLFTFYKFRTMTADAAVRFPELYAYRYTRQEFADSLFKSPVDPRHTRLGRRLRPTSLDELPNLVNVLRGDMSLVGPRPELPQLVQYYTPEELAKFSVRPGITGIHQVSGRAGVTFGQQLVMDLDYLSRRSFAFDLGILAKTVRVVVLRVGAF